MEISQEDKQMLLEIIGTDPDFVDQYLGSNNLNFTVGECAKALGLCNNSIIYRIKTGSIKASRDSEGFWQVSAKDFQDHIKKGGNQKGFSALEKPNPKLDSPKTKPTGETQMKKSYLYDKSSSQNVLDFLTIWEKANSVGFSLKTITADFNKVCATETTEGQMSGILASLNKKKIVVRKGRGIYALVEGFKATSHSVPVVQVEHQEFLHETEEERKSREYEELKSEERHLVDKFLAKHASPFEDFNFTISDLSDEYPNADRKKLGKAVQNMSQNKKLEKGKKMGEYVKRATKKKPTEPDTSRQALSQKLESVIRLDISEELKAKVIKEIMVGE